jgi:hypothetical protein
MTAILVVATMCAAAVGACAGRSTPPAPPPPAITAPPEAHADDVTQASRTGWTSADKAAARQEDAIRKAPAAGIVRVVRVDDECSNAGGTHLTLEVVRLARGGPHEAVAAGGHAIWISAKPGDLFVAGIGPPAAGARRAQKGWCVDDLPAVDGYATTIIAADSIEAADSRLKGILGKK